MATRESRIQFPAGAGATEHRVVIMPANKDANFDPVATWALANVTFPNVDGADEDIRLGDVTVPAGVPAGSYRVQVQTSLPAASAWSDPVPITYALVGVPGPVTVA